VETFSHICIGVASVTFCAWILGRAPARLSVPVLIVIMFSMVPLNLLHPTIPDGITAYQEPRIIFQILKGMTVAGTCAFVLAYPLLSRKSHWPATLVVALLSFNIVEALFAELRKDITVNVITGLLLIALIPVAARVGTVRDRDGDRVSLPLDWTWILIYALWNFAFVLQITGQGRWIVFNFTQILAPAILIGFRPDRFMKARITTLFAATFLWQGFGVYEPLFAASDVWSERQLMLPIRNVAFAIVLVYAFHTVRCYLRTGDVRTLIDAVLHKAWPRLNKPARSQYK